LPRLFRRAGERGGRRGKPRLYRVCVIARWSSEKRTSDTESSREAAQECSPQPALSLSKGRNPWAESGTRASPEGAKEKLRPRLRRDDPALTHTLQRCDNRIVLNAASSRWGNAAMGKHCSAASSAAPCAVLHAISRSPPSQAGVYAHASARIPACPTRWRTASGIGKSRGKSAGRLRGQCVKSGFITNHPVMMIPSRAAL
jgi:hypothetical protein